MDYSSNNSELNSRPSTISSTLLDQLRARRPEAWRRIVRLYGPVIYRWCRQANLKAEDSADIVQEVLSAVASGLPRFRRELPGDSFTGWLATITRNKIREQFRRRRGRAEARGGSTAMRQFADFAQPEITFDGIQPDRQAAALLSQRVLDMIRVEFEDRTWQAFWRMSVGGQSAADVAHDLAMSVASVHMAKYRVLRRLRQVLAELPDAE